MRPYKGRILHLSVDNLIFRTLAAGFYLFIFTEVNQSLVDLIQTIKEAN